MASVISAVKLGIFQEIAQVVAEAEEMVSMAAALGSAAADVASALSAVRLGIFQEIVRTVA